MSLVIQHKAAALNPESSQVNQSSWAESMLWAESWYEKQHRETRQCDCLESEIMDVTVPCWRTGWPDYVGPDAYAGTTASHADGLVIWRLKKQRRRVFECVEGSRLLHHLQNKPFRSISDCFYPNHLHATDAALESVSCFELPIVSFTLHLLRCRFPACVRAVPKNTKCCGEECDSRHNKLKDRAHNNAKYIYDILSHGG